MRTTDRLHQPIALVTMVLDSAQLVAASSGLDGWLAAAGGTPVEWSFCARAVGSRQPYVVNDARTHPIQRSNPLVAIDNIGCYAGVPLYSPDGHALGAHCVVGTEPHDFTAEEIEELQEAGDEIAVLLETYRRQSAA
ncbi:MAG: GAF domain-containing protein [Ilumatobacteraceae bacterium]